MFQAAVNVFKVPELRRRIFFTVGLLAIFRVGEFIPLPGINQEALAEHFKGAGGPLGQLFAMISMFSGGNLAQSTLFGLGIMPYISASIIFQLLATVVPALEKLQKEGESGRRKINEYTRYATVLLCFIQAAFWLRYVQGGGEGGSFVYSEWRGTFSFWAVGLIGSTAGTIFLMWLGEQIDEYGIGNGISLLIMAGIVARLPPAVMNVYERTSLEVTAAGDATKMGLASVSFLVVSFLFVVAGTVLITQAQRRIPIQQAKQVRGRRLYGGQRQYLPLRVNHAGVMPIIFASSLMIFPNIILEWLNGLFQSDVIAFLAQEMSYGRYLYILTDILLIVFFCYFWTSVQFQPKEMARQLQDHGTFVPGLRPGKRTADYLEKVMERITYVGAGFLCVISVIPTVVAESMNVPFQVAGFLGGTGLLIVVSVALDLVQRIEAGLTMHHYGGFLGGEGKIKGAYG
jgi:preprotein translocase subunit SecY